MSVNAGDTSLFLYIHRSVFPQEHKTGTNQHSYIDMHMTKLIYRWWESIKCCRKGGEKFCITDTKLLMHIMLFSIPGEWSYSTNLMWKEQEVPATVIGVDKSAGVRKADGTLNHSWCRVGYL